mgnify:CR=1 FL=1
MNDNTKKMILNRNGDWFVEHGYTHPNDIIDHNANLQLPEKFIQIFSAYNQHNIAESKEWDTWPEWELVLTSLDDFLTFGEPETDPPELVAEREHWLALMQFMHGSSAISIDGYTVTVTGNYIHFAMHWRLLLAFLIVYYMVRVSALDAH